MLLRCAQQVIQEGDIELEDFNKLDDTAVCDAELTVEGMPDPKTGMLMDLGLLRAMAEEARERLDHRMLNEVEGLGPPTLENLCQFLWRYFEEKGCKPSRVAVRRDAMGDGCVLKR